MFKDFRQNLNFGLDIWISVWISVSIYSVQYSCVLCHRVLISSTVPRSRSPLCANMTEPCSDRGSLLALPSIPDFLLTSPGNLWCCSGVKCRYTQVHCVGPSHPGEGWFQLKIKITSDILILKSSFKSCKNRFEIINIHITCVCGSAIRNVRSQC